MKIAVPSALWIACLVLTFACSEAPSTTSTTGSGGALADAKAACSLLTADDIREVMGVAPGPSKFESNQCIWPAADGSNDFLVQLMVVPTLLRSYDELAKQYKEELNTDPATAIHRIDGVGNFAVGFNEMPMVQIFTDARMVQVATFKNEENHALELAKRVADRLD